jgi:hypothetical protein
MRGTAPPRVNWAMTVAAAATICPYRFTATVSAVAAAAATTNAVFASTAAAFWLIVVAPPLPLFPSLLPAQPLPLVSANAIAMLPPPKSLPLFLPLPPPTFFAAVTTSALIPPPTANVFTVQTIPLFLPLPHHCLCLRCLCHHCFHHGSHHCQNFQPAGWSAPAKDGSSGHHGQVSWEQEVYFRQYFSIID